MRRQDKQISDLNQIERVIQKGTVVHIAMMDGDKPYQIPLNYGYQDNSFYIHSAREGKMQFFADIPKGRAGPQAQRKLKNNWIRSSALPFSPLSGFFHPRNQGMVRQLLAADYEPKFVDRVIRWCLLDKGSLCRSGFTITHATTDSVGALAVKFRVDCKLHIKSSTGEIRYFDAGGSRAFENKKPATRRAIIPVAILATCPFGKAPCRNTGCHRRSGSSCLR